MTIAVPSPRGWTPQSEASLLWWLDASDPSTITMDGSNRVSNWNNKQSTGFGNITSSGADRPTWNATGISSRPSVDFSSQKMTGTFSHTGANTTTFFLGIILTGHTANSGVFYGFAEQNQSTNQNLGWTTIRQNGGTPGIEGLYDFSVYSEHDVALNIPFIATGTRSSTAISTYVNGGTPFGATRTVTTKFDRCCIGCVLLFNGIGVATAAFRVGEILTFASGNVALQEKVEGYLAWRWGATLATGHSWKQRAP